MIYLIFTLVILAWVGRNFITNFGRLWFRICVSGLFCVSPPERMVSFTWVYFGLCITTLFSVFCSERNTFAPRDYFKICIAGLFSAFLSERSVFAPISFRFCSTWVTSIAIGFSVILNFQQSGNNFILQNNQYRAIVTYRLTSIRISILHEGMRFDRWDLDVTGTKQLKKIS